MTNDLFKRIVHSEEEERRRREKMSQREQEARNIDAILDKLEKDMEERKGLFSDILPTEQDKRMIEVQRKANNGNVTYLPTTRTEIQSRKQSHKKRKSLWKRLITFILG